jgi:hypothetical protein
MKNEKTTRSDNRKKENIYTYFKFENAVLVSSTQRLEWEQRTRLAGARLSCIIPNCFLISVSVYPFYGIGGNRVWDMQIEGINAEILHQLPLQLSLGAFFIFLFFT